MARRSPPRGFTLIELLVALGVMALMAGLSWRGIDGMASTQARLKQHADHIMTLQAGLAQWNADLDAMLRLPNTPALDWDGRALRVTRRNTGPDSDGLVVAAWTLRSVDGRGYWIRWQSSPVRTRGELQNAWLSAAQWAQNPSTADKQREVKVIALDQWKVFFFRGDAWTNPLSSDGAPPPPPTPTGAGASEPTSRADLVVPDGIRLVLTLPSDSAIAGTLTRDWERLTNPGGKS